MRATETTSFVDMNMSRTWSWANNVLHMRATETTSFVDMNMSRTWSDPLWGSRRIWKAPSQIAMSSSRLQQTQTIQRVLKIPPVSRAIVCAVRHSTYLGGPCSPERPIVRKPPAGDHPLPFYLPVPQQAALCGKESGAPVVRFAQYALCLHCSSCAHH